MISLAANGLGNDEIAARLDSRREVVGRWRKRFFLRDQYPTLTLVHAPVHASWLNQVEIYFSIIQRKVLTPNDFQSLDMKRCA
ncbi:MAG TPA: hypothetical protein VME43_18070 [Bryobacteraceae bacterium]|nr:hypothetical protein [Bryobacteraceae bacterium]